jgi:hypothetical protein
VIPVPVLAKGVEVNDKDYLDRLSVPRSRASGFAPGTRWRERSYGTDDPESVTRAEVGLERSPLVAAVPRFLAWRHLATIALFAVGGNAEQPACGAIRADR